MAKATQFVSDDPSKFQAPMWLDIGTASTTRRFLSVDISPVADIQINLEGSQGHIPIADNQVSIINCSHLLEHLTFDGAQCTLYDMYRMLTDDGFVSIVVPDTDTNSFWKGLRDHKDMRMNPYFFRSTSTQKENSLAKLPYFMSDYDGHSFGMQQSYMTGGFDFEILHIKYYPTHKYMLASDDLVSFASRSFTNVMDSYRVMLKKSGSTGPKSVNYLDLILSLPQIEMDREVMYIRQKVRKFNDLSDILINDFGFLEESALVDVIYNIELFDFAKHAKTQYRILRNDVDEILERLKGAATPVDLEDLREAMKIADIRYGIIAANLDDIQSRTPRLYRSSDRLKAPEPPHEVQAPSENESGLADEIAAAAPHVAPQSEPTPAPDISPWTRLLRWAARLGRSPPRP